MRRVLFTLLMLCLPVVISRAEAPDLFAGGDLAKHWETKGNWKLSSDGVATLEPRPGEKGWTRYDMYLWLKGSYTEFVAEFEYQFEPKGNSGFYFHVGDQADPVAKGIEVQLYDSGAKPKNAKLTDHDAGGIIPRIPPSKNIAKPAGEWNAMRVEVKGRKLTVHLNGELVNDVDLDRAELKGRPTAGAIGFQDHGMPLKLRKFSISGK